jgi:hypothetical protein
MGTVITLSPRKPLADAERLARSRLSRDGSVQFVARTADRRQVAELRRLYGRLLGTGAIPGVLMSLADRPDGTTRLSMFREGRSLWRGEPKTG